MSLTSIVNSGTGTGKSPQRRKRINKRTKIDETYCKILMSRILCVGKRVFTKMLHNRITRENHALTL